MKSRVAIEHFINELGKTKTAAKYFHQLSFFDIRNSIAEGSQWSVDPARDVEIAFGGMRAPSYVRGVPIIQRRKLSRLAIMSSSGLVSPGIEIIVLVVSLKQGFRVSQVAQGCSVVGLFSIGRELWNCNCCQNTDDGDYYHEFNEGEPKRICSF